MKSVVVVAYNMESFLALGRNGTCNIERSLVDASPNTNVAKLKRC